MRKHINTKVAGKTVNHSRQRPAPGAADHTASGQSAEESKRYREENAKLKQDVANLRRELFQARQNVDPIQRFITDTSKEARTLAHTEQEWHQIKKRLWLSFHPDKNVCKETAHKTWVAMQNHQLYNW